MYLSLSLPIKFYEMGQSNDKYFKIFPVQNKFTFFKI